MCVSTWRTRSVITFCRHFFANTEHAGLLHAAEQEKKEKERPGKLHRRVANLLLVPPAQPPAVKMAPLQPPACGKPHEKYMLKKKEEYAKSKTAVVPPTQARGFDDPFEVDPVEANKPTSGKAFCGCCPGAATPLPIETVDLEAYSGHWYQVYASCIPKWLFECGGLATTADYGPVDGIEATALSVKNFGRCFPCFAQMCPTKCPGWGLKGFVVQSPDDAQGALTVSLGPCATVLRRRAGEGQVQGARQLPYHQAWADRRRPVRLQCCLQRLSRLPAIHPNARHRSLQGGIRGGGARLRQGGR